MPIIQAPLSIQGGPTSPRADPTAFGGGEALQTFGRMAEGFANQRLEQLYATQLATLRATVGNEVADFVQGLDLDVEFATMPQRWADFRAARMPAWQASVASHVWSTAESDISRMLGEGSRAVSSRTHAVESDHMIAQWNASNAAIVEGASRPGANPAADLAMLESNAIEGFRSAMVSEASAGAALRSNRTAYMENYYRGQIGRDPIAFLNAHAVETAAPMPAPAAPATTGQTAVDIGQAVFNRAVQLFGDHASVAAQASGGMPGQDGLEPIEFVRELARVADEAGIENPEGLTELRDLANAEPTEAPVAAPSAPPIISYTPLEGVDPQTSDALFALAERRGEDMMLAQQVDVERRIEAEVTAIANGIPVTDRVTPAEIAGAYRFDPSRAEQITADLAGVRTIAADVARFEGMSNTAIRTYVASERAALVQSPTLPAQVGRIEALERAALGENGIIARRLADPGGAAVAAMPELRTLFETAAQTGNPETWAAAVNLSIRRQEQFVDHAGQIQPLPVSFVTPFMDAYGRAPAPERVTMLRAVTAGLEGEGGDRVMSQLEANGLDPGIRYIVDAPLSDAQAGDMLDVLAQAPALLDQFSRSGHEQVERTQALDRAALLYEQARGNTWADRTAILPDQGQSLAAAAVERDLAQRLAVGFATLQRVPPYAPAPPLRAILQMGPQGLFYDEMMAAMPPRRTDVPDVESAMRGVLNGLFGDQAAMDGVVGVGFVPAAQAAEIVAGMEVALGQLRLVDPETFADFIGISPAAIASAQGIPTSEAAGFVQETWQALVDGALFVNEGDGYAVRLPLRGSRGLLLTDSEGRVRTWTVPELVALAPEVVEERSEERLDELMPEAVDRYGADTVIQP